jgi:ribosomal protein S18 acetylase RimI-like enzyme
MNDPVRLCAEAYAAWHTSWLRAFGIASERTGELWRALERPPLIYLAGITLEPGVASATLADAPGSVGDAWSDLDLGSHGFRVWRKEPWFYRPAAPVEESSPEELEIVRVRTPDEVVEFEAVSVRGFGNEDDVVEPGIYHPPAILGDDAMHMFTGRVSGRPVAAAMGYVFDGGVGVFGVTTVASARGRGYGSAVTRAAMLAETGLPAVLAPSDMAASMYRRLGFEPVGELTIWSTDPAP